ncbi:MAG: HAD family hydrolase [Phototrophicaceae bacterium]
MSEPIKGVLFDLDNTLIDWRKSGGWDASEQHHLGLIHQFLAEKQRPLNGTVEKLAKAFRNRASHAWDQARTTLRTPHIVSVMEAVLRDFGFVADHHITMQDVMVAYDWGKENGVVTFPDVPDALQKLVDDGIHIAIVTNAWQPMWMRDPELIHHDLIQFFPDENRRISAADVGYLKPHPQIFHHALEQIGTTPENTLFVGDNSTADIAGAQGVGMRAVLRVNDPIPPAISRLVTPDAIISDFNQLLNLVDDWDTAVAQ